jgi:hypothetical protein
MARPQCSMSIGSKEVVTPLKNGVQRFCNDLEHWIPAFAGMTEQRLLGLITNIQRCSMLNDQCSMLNDQC